LKIENCKLKNGRAADDGPVDGSRSADSFQFSIFNFQFSISSLIRRLHNDQRGTVSIATVFALFMFTVLLVQIVNVGRRVDDKIRMQNAADAGAYSGGVVISRGMNVLAFTNHLEAEVFALDAYMRTAQMKDASGQLAVAGLTPEILAKWDEIGKVFEQFGGSSGYVKFAMLGKAIQLKVPLERDVVATFSEMSARHAELTQPVLEYVLNPDGGGSVGGGGFGSQVGSPEGGLIPRFQRVVVRTTPRMANLTVNEIAQRYGRPGERLRRTPTQLQGRMWRTDAVAFIDTDESDPLTRTLPAIDPSPTGVDGPPSQTYYTVARQQRQQLATHYLEMWIRDWMGPYFSYSGGVSVGGSFNTTRFFDRPGRDTAKMSQFINLWRTFACGHLRVLLDVEYPDTNLPHVIRAAAGNVSSNQTLERDHQFVSVAYSPHLREMFPGLYRNPLHRDGSDAVTFAQVQIFLPRNRHLCCPWAWPIPQRDGTIRWRNNMDGWPQHWDLLNQNWQCKLVPATSRSVPQILSRAPSDLPNFRPPRMTGVSEEDFRQLNQH
jgi:hypothetical protein